MTPQQEQVTQTFEKVKPNADATTPEIRIGTRAPASSAATTCTGGDRDGWRRYFVAATRKTLKRRETEMQAQKRYQRLRGRFATTMATLVCALFLFAATASAKTITVTGTNDTIAVDGIVTLREAITAANTNAPCGDAPAGEPGLDIITFNIPGSGVQTINLTSELPQITERVTIDGYTQGATPNSLAVGSNAVLLIELNGAGAGASASGLYISAGDTTVKGLILNRFNNRGIYIDTNGGNVIAGNFIGTDASGANGLPSPNNVQGIYVSSPNNVIGGVTPADRNVISGNGVNGPGGTGIMIDTPASTGNKVIGNYIGTDASGMTGLGNLTNGVTLSYASFNIIGGATPAERNVISGNNNSVGVNLAGTSSNNQVLGNYIGTRSDGSAGSFMGNGSGVSFSSTASNNTIGSKQSGGGNVIAFSFTAGVLLGQQNTGNSILGNSIYGNGPSTTYLGIDLLANGFGVTPNDDNTGDADTGANGLQNFPVLTSVMSAGGNTQIKGTLDSAFSQQFRIEFFSNTAADPSGFGEGEKYLGFVDTTTDASGKATFTFNVPTANVVGNFFSATATDPAGNTSEFSACASGVVGSPGTLQLSTSFISQFENTGAFTINVTRSNGSSGTVSVDYATSDGTAKAPADYTSVSGTLTFNDGETSKPISVPIINDNIPEDTEALTISLTNPTGGAVLGNIPTATLGIENDDLPTISITDVSLSEGDSGTTTFTFSVLLSNPMPNNVTVNFATANNTAQAGSDYQATSGLLTFAPGQVSKEVIVVVNGDTDFENTETFFVVLSNPSDATISKAQGVGKIINDDAPKAGTLQFISASFSANENGGQATITVKRTSGSDGAVSIQYATVAGGTATAGSDYASANGTLSWANGDASDKTFTVAITDDSLNEANETINLNLTNPAGGAALGNPSTAVVTIVDNDPQPSLSISDVSQAEGNSATTSFNFEVTLSAASGQTITVNYVTADQTALLGNDYQPASGILTFGPGEIAKPLAVIVNGDIQVEPDETFFVNLSNPGNATIIKAQGTGTIINDDAQGGPTVQFSQANYSVQEDLGALTVTVTRSDASGSASVDYATADGTATQKSDYEITTGTLNFAAGEASKTLQVLINEDSYIEGNETFNFVLSNASGASLGQQSTATITIIDDVPESATNPIGDAQSFVHTHYHDFLNREPDQVGLQFWINEIGSCSQNAACVASKRVNVSAAYFLSIEFQQTGFLLHLVQKESFGGLPKYAAFMRDLQEVSRGVIVGTPGWEQKLADNQRQFAERWVNRSAFKAAYDGMSNAGYVNALYANAGIIPPQAERNAMVAALDTATESRAAVLLDVAANAAFKQQEQNSAFVLMQYFGYLRRDPDAAPDSDLSGFYFWLQKMNAFNGDYQKAEMVKAFLDSSEYRSRFGQQ